MSEDRRIRALAFNAVGRTLKIDNRWLPLSTRQAVADAVLEAVKSEPEPESLTPRERAYAAVTEHVRKLGGRVPVDVDGRDEMIWHAVHVALSAAVDTPRIVDVPTGDLL